MPEARETQFPFSKHYALSSSAFNDYQMIVLLINHLYLTRRILADIQTSEIFAVLRDSKSRLDRDLGEFFKMFHDELSRLLRENDTLTPTVARAIGRVLTGDIDELSADERKKLTDG